MSKRPGRIGTRVGRIRDWLAASATATATHARGCVETAQATDQVLFTIWYMVCAVSGPVWEEFREAEKETKAALEEVAAPKAAVAKPQA